MTDYWKIDDLNGFIDYLTDYGWNSQPGDSFEFLTKQHGGKLT